MARKRLQGIAFLLVVFSLIGLSIAKYNGAFESGEKVILKADRVGNQLKERSDVKVRGLIVGKVEKITSDGAEASIELSIQPGKLDQIPDNVTARLLPKTLFGERYVSLVIPENPSPTHLKKGAVIGQDRTETAREIDRVLDGLLPLLQAVEPDQLATTLGSLSQALSGRGEKLGETLVQMQQYVSSLNTALPTLQEDITRFADASNTYADAAPDLINALDDLSTTSRTVAEQRENLSGLYATLTRASDDLGGFLNVNRENLIGVSADARPTLESLARYAPEVPCFLAQAAGLVPRIDDIFGVGTSNPALRITLEVVNTRGKYIPNQDEPRYLDDRGPRCYPTDPVAPTFPADGGPFRDGSVPDDERVTGGRPDGVSVITQGAMNPAYSMGIANSSGEQAIIAELMSASTGMPVEDVPGWSSLLIGPLLRGTEVELR